MSRDRVPAAEIAISTHMCADDAPIWPARGAAVTAAYDYVVGTSEEVAARTAGGEPALFAGWAGPEGPAIGGWPRSPRTGAPMMHCFTSWLPEEYRRNGAEHVAVSVFQWDDESSHDFPITVPPEFGGQIVGHPDANVFYALRWLTEAELTGPRTSRPPVPDSLAPGEHDPAAYVEGYKRGGQLWLIPRDDPNAGLAPVDMPEPDDAYVDVRDRWDRFGSQHLGGTFMNPNGPDHQLSPWYLEVNGLGGFDFAGGDLAAIDLDAPTMLGRRLVVDVPFVQLAEWESTYHIGGTTGYARNVFVWIAFAHGLVAVGEADGPTTHAGVYSTHDALTTFAHFFEDDDGAWLRPYIERIQAMEDWRVVRADAVAEYARRHEGATAPTIGWKLER